MLRRRRKKSSSPEILESRALLTTITVTSLADVTADDGQTTLREAVLEAESIAGADSIVFDAGLSGVIQLTQGPIVVAGHEVVIEGNGRAATVIDANGADVIFDADNSNPVDLTLRSLSLQNANDHAVAGDATSNQRIRIQLEDVLITGTMASHAFASSFTGAVSVSAAGANRASLTIRDSEISGNNGTACLLYTSPSPRD